MEPAAEIDLDPLFEYTESILMEVNKVHVHVEEFIDVLLPLVHIMEEHFTRTNLRYWKLGRPRFKIDEVQLEFLIESSFRLSDIASMFGCSKCTTERRINYLGLSRYSVYQRMT